MERDTASKHTLHGLNFYLSYFDDIASLLPKDAHCFIVGGWVRDRILGEPIGYDIDVDLLVTCDPADIAYRFAQLTGGHFFVFEKKRFLLRRSVVASVVIHIPPYRYRFDFSQLKGKNLEKALEKDLKDRDFTINAMAVNMDDVLSIGAKQTFVFDPTGGMKDLEKGILRPISFKNLKSDPVRILRGYRLAVEKDLELTSEFTQFVERNKNLILKSPPERITYELFKIIRNPSSAPVLRRLSKVSILETIVPEFAQLKKIEDQGKNHIYSLEEHTFKTLEELERILRSEVGIPFSEIFEKIGKTRFLGEFTDIELLKWAALFHDIGKPATFEIKKGKVTFYNHDKVGEKIFKEIGIRLRWGEKATKFTAKLIRYHLRLFYLRESLFKGELKRKGMIKFWRECSDIAYHLFLLSVADARASGDSQEEINALGDLIRKLENFKEKELKEDSVKALLNGKEIMAILGIPPGKVVGELKRRLEEAQLEKRVRTKEEAEKFIKSEYLKISSSENSLKAC